MVAPYDKQGATVVLSRNNIPTLLSAWYEIGDPATFDWAAFDAMLDSIRREDDTNERQGAQLVLVDSAGRVEELGAKPQEGFSADRIDADRGYWLTNASRQWLRRRIQLYPLHQVIEHQPGQGWWCVSGSALDALALLIDQDPTRAPMFSSVGDGEYMLVFGPREMIADLLKG